MKLPVIAATLLVLAGCAGGAVQPPVFVPPTPPALSWTASWAQGTQTGAIDFQAKGQTATLTATARGGNLPPYPVSSGACVTVSTPTTSGQTESVTVTAANSGTCNIVFGNNVSSATIGASVP